MKRVISLWLCCCLCLILGACSSNSQETKDVQLGFLTLDGNGIANHPFSDIAQLAVEWEENAKPEWTALPIWVTGTLDDKVLRNATASSYSYTIGTSEEADAYYTIIADGYQEQFEDLWTEVYNKLNGVVEFSVIDASVPADIISLVYGDESYGTLRDTMTDALALIREVNEDGPSETYNEEAGRIYNEFYRWLYNFSVDSL